MESSARLKFQVGVFLTMGLALGFAVIFLIGKESAMFESKTQLWLKFKDIQGLTVGAKVLLAGMSVGTVDEISFTNELGDKQMHIRIAVRNSMMPRVRGDSRAAIGSKGLLGDKVVQLTVGSEGEPQLQNGDYIISDQPPDMFEFLKKGDKIIDKTQEIATYVRDMLKEYSDEDTTLHVKGILASIDEMMWTANTGEGLVNGILYDKQLKDDTKRAVAKAGQAVAEFEKTGRILNDVLREVRGGQGTLHSLIYDQEGKKIVRNLLAATENIAEVVREVREGNGVVHTVIYDEDAGNFIRNLEEATADLKTIIKSIKQGQGTVGSLVKDPTVYEDLKTILGNVKRSEVLKAIVRLNLKTRDQDDEDRRLEAPSDNASTNQPQGDNR